MKIKKMHGFSASIPKRSGNLANIISDYECIREESPKKSVIMNELNIYKFVHLLYRYNGVYFFSLIWFV